ncbi:hypothetical protein GCM10025793_22310 [Lysobacter lycopersici]
MVMILATIPSHALATSFCERMLLDPEVPAGLDGSYEIVGKDPATGAAYTGTLVLGIGKDSYAITRTTGADIVNGDAWMESCGMDKIKALVVRYYTKPVTEMSCALDADGDNYYRATCRTHQVGQKRLGLEAWFQRP